MQHIYPGLFDDRCIRNISRVMNMHVSVFANIWSCHVYKSSALCTFHEDESVLQHKGNFSLSCSSELSYVFCTVYRILSHELLVSCRPCFLFALGKNTRVAVIIRGYNCSTGYEKW